MRRLRHVQAILVVALCCTFTSNAIEMSRTGCGETRGCMFRPAGCDPMMDCTLGMIFHVSGPNELTVQLSATSLVPPPPLQYIAIGFSHDSIMSDDYVIECVLGPQSSQTGEPEVFASYNTEEKSNLRTYLNSTEHTILFNNISGDVTDMRISCQFTVQIVPQLSSKNGRIWNLNHKYYIFGATGSARPDQVNAHDTSQGSHYYPIVSARAINPALIGAKVYDLPHPFEESTTSSTTVDPNEMLTTPEVGSTAQVSAEPVNAASTNVVNLLLLAACFFLYRL